MYLKSPTATASERLRIFTATMVPYHFALCTVPNSPSPTCSHTNLSLNTAALPASIKFHVQSFASTMGEASKYDLACSSTPIGGEIETDSNNGSMGSAGIES